MLVATHVIIGAVIGLCFAPDHAFFALILAFTTHFLIDMIPHGDAELYKKYLRGKDVNRALTYVVLDVIGSILLATLILTRPMEASVREVVAWGIVGGVLPDLLVGIYEQFHLSVFEGFHRFHLWFHNLATKRVGDISFWNGIVMQSVVIAGLFLLF